MCIISFPAVLFSKLIRAHDSSINAIYIEVVTGTEVVYSETGYRNNVVLGTPVVPLNQRAMGRRSTEKYEW